MTDIDPHALRTAFGSFMTGVTVVTALRSDGTPVGFTANSFSSVSLTPPLLLVCPGRFLSSYESFAKCSHFAVSILAEGQEEISNTFARFKGDRFSVTPHRLNADGVPLIDGAVAQFSCKTHKALPAGDHCILIGEVSAYDHTGGAGLGYVGGFSLGLERSAIDLVSGKAVCGAIVEHGDDVLLESTPQGLRPPQCSTGHRGRLIAELHKTLADKGIQADLGQAYSVFENRADFTYHSYFLATAQSNAPAGDVVSVPICELPTQRFTTPAIAKMLCRFSREAQTRSFALYLGDTEDGAIQDQPKRT